MAARRHGTAPTATAALGRTMMSALLLGTFKAGPPPFCPIARQYGRHSTQYHTATAAIQPNIAPHRQCLTQYHATLHHDERAAARHLHGTAAAPPKCDQCTTQVRSLHHPIQVTAPPNTRHCTTQYRSPHHPCAAPGNTFKARPRQCSATCAL